MIGERAIERPTREGLAAVVELRKEELETAIERLKTAAWSTTDLREHVAARPWAWVAAAFLGGLWLGLRGRISSERKTA